MYLKNEILTNEWTDTVPECCYAMIVSSFVDSSKVSSIWAADLQVAKKKTFVLRNVCYEM